MDPQRASVQITVTKPGRYLFRLDSANALSLRLTVVKL
jgi:hypothetical protein